MNSHIQISLHTRFQFKLTILILWTKFNSKEYIWLELEKGERNEFCIFEISRYQNSTSRIKFISKGYSQSKAEKVNSIHHWILHIQIRLGTKFQFKLTFLIFWTKFAQNGYFQSKSEKMKTTIKSCIFKSVYVPNLSLNWKFFYFWPNLPNKVFPVEKWKSEYH